MSFGNTSKDFKIKGANFAGSLKPDPVAERKVTSTAIGNQPHAGAGDRFGSPINGGKAK
ncbi:MAG: hypothetical protein HN802_06810 [Candidatus Jacksonbacteria bacterium]|jgi:hypothetical protein|nr:hypothetical protein [Candidatus Jacksonbacteria bacterium]